MNIEIKVNEKKDYEEQIGDLKEEIEKHKKNAEDLKKEIQTLKSGHEEESNNLQDEFTKKMEILQAKYRKMLKDKDEKYEDLSREFDGYRKEHPDSGKRSKFFS